MFVFVVLSHNYADEFDVECCFVSPKPRFEANLELIKRGFDEGNLSADEHYFGTNEFLTFDDFEDFARGVAAKDCSKEFFDEFTQLQKQEVGFNVFEQLLNKCKDHWLEY